MTKENKNWKLTNEQIDLLSVCQRINEILYIPKNSKTIIASNGISIASSQIFYINENFDYKLNSDFVVYNLGEILKPIKMLSEPIIKVNNSNDEQTALTITDEKESIKCNFLFANESFNNKDLYDKYKELLTKLVDSTVVKFDLTNEFIDNIKKFAAFNYNTLTFLNNEIILHDNLISDDFNEKNNVKFKVEFIENNEKQFDINLKFFRLIEKGDYEFYCSSSNFIYLKQKDGNNNYIISCNSIE